MAGDDALWQLSCLHDAVRVLSEDAEDQIASFGAGHADELGLGFDDGYLLVPTLVAEGVTFSRRSLSLLSQINSALSDMSGHQNADLWTEAAIRERSEWANIRSLAREAQTLLPSVAVTQEVRADLPGIAPC
jgi:hypothetical protein